MIYISALVMAVLMTGCMLSMLWYYRQALQKVIIIPSEHRHRHAQKSLRVGGIAITIGVISTMSFHPDLVIDRQWTIFLCALIIATIVGIWDDMRNISWKYQLCAQAGIVAVGIFGGIAISQITSPSGGVFSLNGYHILISTTVTLIWTVMIVNAFNWSDGLDGLAGGVATIAYSTLFVLALRPEVYQPPFAIVALSFAGALLVFTCVNLLWGRIILGTSGAYVVGFSLAFLAILAGGKIGTTLLVLIVPLCDAVFVVWQRFRAGESVFVADERHLHHHLRTKGYTRTHILLLYYALTMIGAVIALSTAHIHKTILLGSYVLILLVFLYYVTRPEIRR